MSKMDYYTIYLWSFGILFEAWKPQSPWGTNCMEKSNQYNSHFVFQKESKSYGLEQHLHTELGLFVFGCTLPFIPAYVQQRPGRAARVTWPQEVH